MPATTSNKRILLVASAGGHWVQLRRIAPAFAEHDCAYLTVEPSYRDQVGEQRFYSVRDATRWSKIGLLWQASQVLRVVLRERPALVVSTGAAPGYFALRFGKRLGARTVWIDSVANVEQLSMAGQRVRKWADLWLTQWEHLAQPEGPRYVGAVL